MPDPISSSRTSDEKFVMTSYPQRPVKYPIITIKDNGIAATERLGMQSESFIVKIPIEVRIWAKSVTQKDKLFDKTFEVLRTNQFPAGSAGTSSYNDLHDFRMDGALNVDEPGEGGIKSKIINLSYIFIAE